MDEKTALLTIATAVGSAKLAEHLFGKTFAYFGDRLKYWTETGVTNVGNVLKSAVHKVKDRIKEEGSIPPKVVRALVEDAPFCDDPLAAEYFGGVLASSRSGNSRDDRGAIFLAQLQRLSSYQIRAHYLLYHALREVCVGKPKHFENLDALSNTEIHVTQESFNRGMDFTSDEKRILPNLIQQTMFGLQREDLIDSHWAVSGIKASNTLVEQGARSGPGVEFGPTASGIDLFLWAYGRGDLHFSSFGDPLLGFPAAPGIELREDSWLVGSR